MKETEIDSHAFLRIPEFIYKTILGLIYSIITEVEMFILAVLCILFGVYINSVVLACVAFLFIWTVIRTLMNAVIFIKN